MSEGVSESLNILFNKMENFITSKTVVGEAISMGDVLILPLVDVSFGVGAGGAASDKKNDSEKNKNQGGNGGGLGAKLTPSAVIVVTNGNVQLINLKHQDSVSKLIDMAPGIVSKFNLDGFFSKGDKSKSKAEAEIELPKETAVNESYFSDSDDKIFLKTESTVVKDDNEDSIAD